MNEKQDSKDNPKCFVVPKVIGGLDYDPEARDRKDNEAEPFDVRIPRYVVTYSQICCHGEYRKNQDGEQRNQKVSDHRVDQRLTPVIVHK